MSGGTEADLDWGGMDAAAPSESAPGTTGANDAKTATREFLSDEQILGIDAPSPKDGYGGPARDARSAASHRNGGERGVAAGSTENAPREGHAAPQPPPAEAPERASSAPQAQAASAMPPWMAAAAAGDPQHGAEAQRLWQE